MLRTKRKALNRFSEWPRVLNHIQNHLYRSLAHGVPTEEVPLMSEDEPPILPLFLVNNWVSGEQDRFYTSRKSRQEGSDPIGVCHRRLQRR
jgi:hypothetical protein